MPETTIRLAAAIADAADDLDEALSLCVLAASKRGLGRDFVSKLAAEVADRRGWDLRLTFH